MHFEHSAKPSQSAQLAYKVLEIIDTLFRKQQTALQKKKTNGDTDEKGPLEGS